MENGQISFQGDINSTLDRYTKRGSLLAGEKREPVVRSAKKDQKLMIKSLIITDTKQKAVLEFERSEEILITIGFEVITEGQGFNVGIEVWNSQYECVFGSKLFDSNPVNLETHQWDKGEYKYQISIPKDLLVSGVYSINASATIPCKEMLDVYPEELGFVVIDRTSPMFVTGEGRNGSVAPVICWDKV